MRRKIDRSFLIITVILVIVGFLIFSSASLGLLAREGASFSSVAFSQIVLGILLGFVALFLMTYIHHRVIQKYALYIFLTSLAATLLVFVPGVGFEFNGAKRWLLLGPISFQPAEFLKIGFVLYFSAWLSGIRDKLSFFNYSVLPFAVLLSIVATVLLIQPDTGTLMIILAAGLGMFFVGGARWRDIGALLAASIVGAGALVLARPYIMDRIIAFLDPTKDPLGSSYQIQQSLIAIGSGEWFGRGFGQGIQKFHFLPEPIGDSIFAVTAEEFGFVGSVFLISLFLFLALRGLKIATKAPDYFSGLVVVGIVILITAQSFINIASMLGIFPLTGLPLLFVSHGGTALFFTLLEIGIVLSISRFQRG